MQACDVIFVSWTVQQVVVFPKLRCQISLPQRMCSAIISHNAHKYPSRNNLTCLVFAKVGVRRVQSAKRRHCFYAMAFISIHMSSQSLVVSHLASWATPLQKYTVKMRQGGVDREPLHYFSPFVFANADSNVGQWGRCELLSWKWSITQKQRRRLFISAMYLSRKKRHFIVSRNFSSLVRRFVKTSLLHFPQVCA